MLLCRKTKQVVDQSVKSSMSSEAAALLWRHCNVRERETLNNERFVRRLEINAGGNIVNFIKYSSFSTPKSFGQLPVKSVTKRCSICRYSRFTDIEWASKKRFQQSSEAMGIPIQAWMTNNIALFYATWLLIHVQISMMVSPQGKHGSSSSGVLTTCRYVAKW